MVEGGPRVWQSFIDEDLVDQMQIFTAPRKLKKGIPALINTDLPYQKAETLSFDSDTLEIKLLKLY
ncbi:hypothetical protein ACFL10_00495 [Patescibacteria group bacterium]